ncbi:MAG TPA: YjgP/YjgQ family permease, partial [Alphaproteobacteria bacterium]|nr:YjgP/YjgQ family permease [Alphaproteobacteria bacterium]
MTGIIDRYIWRRYLTRLVVGLALFIGVYLLVDLFGHLSDFAAAGWSAAKTARYLMLITPSATMLVLPTACLVATVSLLGTMWQNNELPAILGAGRSWMRAVAPMLLVAALASLLSAAISEWVVPHTQKESIRMRKAMEQDAPSGPTLLALSSGTIFHAGSFSDSGRIAEDVVIWHPEGDGETYIWAKRGTFEDGAWTLHSGVLRRSGGEITEREPFNYIRTDLTVSPEELLSGGTPPSAMSFRELRRYISSIPGAPPPEMAVELYLKSALPFASLVLAIVG